MQASRGSCFMNPPSQHLSRRVCGLIDFLTHAPTRERRQYSAATQARPEGLVALGSWLVVTDKSEHARHLLGVFFLGPERKRQAKSASTKPDRIVVNIDATFLQNIFRIAKR